MNDPSPSGALIRAEAALAAELRETGVPDSVGATVMRHFERRRARRTEARQIVAGWILAGTIAAVVIAAVGIGTAKRPQAQALPIVPPAAQPVRESVVTAAPPREDVRLHAPVRRRAPSVPAAPAEEQPFIAIPYTVPLAADERATVVRMSLPIPALAAAGLTVVVPEPDAQAQADVIVGEDGRARAIRILSISTSDRSYR